MKSQACVPCAKRKVRCDREEPCSNCKRRKQDQCVYSDVTPAQRIKELEALVQTLRKELEAGPESDQVSKLSRKRKATEGIDSDSRLELNSALIEQEGEALYIENNFHRWDRNNSDLFSGDLHSSEKLQPPEVIKRTPSSPDALRFMTYRDPGIDLAQRHPTSQHCAILWDAFKENVNPLTKLSFEWELDHLRKNTTLHGARRDFTYQEHAFLFALYFVSVRSLSDEECEESFVRSKSSLQSEFQMLCEQAFVRTGFPGTLNMMTLKASALYIAAGFDRLSTRSLWAMMGLVIRGAERLGLHRDGTYLGLSPSETERRRRIWWYLQHLDLALSVRSGATTLTLAADWDTHMPLNIEDDDLSTSANDFPTERDGITGMSYCLWTYWVLYEQRNFRRPDGTRFGILWISARSVSDEVKQEFIKRLENGLNDKFLKYCDPIRPLDNLIQLLVRSFICGMRRFTLRSKPLNLDPGPNDLVDKDWMELLEHSIRSLEYCVAINTCKQIQHFSWLLESYFQWSALVFVVLEARRHCNAPKTERIWKLLSELYSCDPDLYGFPNNRKTVRAAELIVTTWKERENFLRNRDSHQSQIRAQMQKPLFIEKLESQLAIYKANLAAASESIKLDTASQDQSAVDVAESSYFDIDAFAESTLNEIDWSFWDSMA